MCGCLADRLTYEQPIEGLIDGSVMTLGRSARHVIGLTSLQTQIMEFNSSQMLACHKFGLTGAKMLNIEKMPSWTQTLSISWLSLLIAGPKHAVHSIVCTMALS